ncbi:Gfo/Idh/MocA family oxidoreductase [Membranicola marinus]|uniref:Gfo/Idh/MocA family oxidoreductase n=1 Tax=Membranihabitans marinus TaxID=1227546 RepID=A0A953HRK2_9BACT|nr:Gfo/Idh/MocA family oxidoreductase [Membranihabitans marinus]MBY5959618.1 Gfo/Idh/MocA family oxidoreductase [Membranihabitans marinus]
MSDKKKVRIGLVGRGLMGRMHANAYTHISTIFPDLEYQPVLQAIASRNEEKGKEFADTWGFQSYENDWRKMIERDDIDAIDICAPNNMHAEIAIAAAKAGKMVLSEKPLSHEIGQAKEMLDAITEAGVPNTVWYNYRRMPAVTLAKNIVDSGRLGQIFHYRANFLQDWTISPDLPQGGEAAWRLDVDAAGSGVTGDLLAHCIDTAIWLNGGIEDVSAVTKTFIKERLHQETGKVQPVGIDDASIFHCHFKNGSLGLFEATRYARGHKALYTFEINGEHASIRWDLHDMNWLEYFDHRDDAEVRGWRKIHVSDGDQPYMDRWWIPGTSLGYEHSFIHQAADFFKGLENGGKRCAPTIEDAYETEKVCHAVLESAKSRSWKTV